MKINKIKLALGLVAGLSVKTLKQLGHSQPV